MRKMFLAMAKDIRVIIIKLADRLAATCVPSSIHDTGEAAGKSEGDAWIYDAPMAQRLGIS